MVYDYDTSYGYDNIIPPRTITFYDYPDPIFEGDIAKRVRKAWPHSLRTWQLTSSLYTQKGRLTDEGVLPRFKSYDQYEVIQDDNKTLARLYDSGFDYQNILLLQETPDIQPSDHQTGEDKIVLIKEKFNSISLQVTAKGALLLLINDTDDPGWSAEIDREPCKIIRANYNFRALALPAGSHTVTLKYSHRGMKAGLILCISSLCIIMLLTATALVIQIKNKKDD